MYRSIYYIFSLALIPWGETINVKRAVDLQQEACSVLENHEVYSSVKVAIGNPPQLFDLVADTGSDNCIVNDCSCKQCPKAWGSCFTEHSNSFRLPMFKVPVKVLYSPKLSVHMRGCKSNMTLFICLYMGFVYTCAILRVHLHQLQVRHAPSTQKITICYDCDA